MFRTAVVAAMLLIGGASFAQTAPTMIDTAEQRAAFSADAIKTITANAGEVAKLTEQAKKDGDAGVLDCLTPRNVSMQALVQVAEGAKKKMDAAVAAGDMEAHKYEFRKIQVSLEKANSIKAEANNCLAGEGNQGNNQIDVNQGVGNETDTTDNDELDDLDVGFDPPNVSQF